MIELKALGCLVLIVGLACIPAALWQAWQGALIACSIAVVGGLALGAWLKDSDAD